MATINTDEWMAELDRVAATCTPIVDDRGFTVDDLVRVKGMSRSTAERIVRVRVAAGEVAMIGKRSGYGAARVYEAVRPAQ